MSHWGKFEYRRVVPEGIPVTIYHLSGGLTGTAECYEFLEQVGTHARKGEKLVVLDLTEIEHMTSAGVGILAACYTSLSNAGGRLRLVGIPARARAILNLVKLVDILGDDPTVEDAVRALLA